MKLFANSFYSVKIQLFNEFYFTCQKDGVNYNRVKELMIWNGWINPMHTVVPGSDGNFSYVSPELSVTGRAFRILERELADYVLNVDQADNIVVIKTVSGHAQSVCEAIDRMGWNELMGTLAGDNTIFALARSAEDGLCVVNRLELPGTTEPT